MAALTEELLLELFPRRASAYLLAQKWPGRKTSHVAYSDPRGVCGVFEQMADAATIVGDMACIFLGRRIDAPGLFSGEVAPIKYCKLKN